MIEHGIDYGQGHCILDKKEGALVSLVVFTEADHGCCTCSN